jgi:hypothetical protein
VTDDTAPDYVLLKTIKYAFYKREVKAGEEVSIPDPRVFDRLRDHYFFPIAPSITLEPAAE